MTNPTPNPTLLDFALDAVHQIGRLTLGHFHTRLNAERKADNTPVTIADKQAEEKLRDLIGKAWPDHGIIGEEFEAKPPAAEDGYTWIIDPIDGTKSFVSGVPLYANLLALTKGGQPLLGVANFPALGEMVYAVKGGGCFWNGRTAHVSSVNQLKEAVLLVSGLNYFGDKEAAWKKLVEATYIQRTWGDAYGYFLVATGRAEIMLDPAMYLWDSAPFQIIIEEAGGVFSDWRGTPTIYSGDSLAANAALYPQVIDIVKNA
jgi:histidinol phosphatase-like enzyme (inositol monophosphatase family)